MGERERCFICAGAIWLGDEVAVMVRTGVPAWRRRLACRTCARRLRDVAELLVVRDGEWWTVRLNGHEPVGE